MNHANISILKINTIELNRSSKKSAHLCLNLGLEGILEGDGISGELADTLAELVNGHWVLVEVEAEVGLVVNVRLLLQVERAGVGRIQLLGDRVLRVVELLEQVGLSPVSKNPVDVTW